MADAPKITKVEVKRDLCIGSASCIAISAASFELDNEGKAVVKAEGVATTDGKTLLEAAQACPTKAIYLYDETGKQVYP